jgi:hypothetical protein
MLMNLFPVIAFPIGGLILILHVLGVNSFLPFYYRLGIAIYRHDYKLSRPLPPEQQFLRLGVYVSGKGVVKVQPDYKGYFRAKQDRNRKPTIYSLTGSFRIVDEVLQVTVRLNPILILVVLIIGLMGMLMMNIPEPIPMPLLILPLVLLSFIGVMYKIVITSEFSQMKKTAQDIFTRIQRESNPN